MQGLLKLGKSIVILLGCKQMKQWNIGLLESTETAVTYFLATCSMKLSAGTDIALVFPNI